MKRGGREGEGRYDLSDLLQRELKCRTEVANKFDYHIEDLPLLERCLAVQ